MQFHLPKLKLPTFSKATQTIGLPPGQLIHLGEKLTDKSSVELIRYNAEKHFEHTSEDPQVIINEIDRKQANWINIDGLHNIDLIKKLGEHFDINSLVLEDVLNPDQRPKIEDFDNHLFFTLKTLNTLQSDIIIYEQMSFILGENYLLSFQEKEGDLFDGFRGRLKNDPKSKARKKDVDFLFYRLIDTIVDSYYLILESIAERIEVLEDELFLNPSSETLQKIQILKKELIFLRKSVYPLREAISLINKGEFSFIKKDTQQYFRDVYDHTIQVIETLETYRDLSNGLMDMYMTSMSNKMNEVMKVLTVIATIFIPLTFIAGVYGMNFQHMPELNWKYGYAGVWGLMLACLVLMLIYFKRKKWF